MFFAGRQQHAELEVPFHLVRLQENAFSQGLEGCCLLPVPPLAQGQANTRIALAEAQTDFAIAVKDCSVKSFQFRETASQVLGKSVTSRIELQRLFKRSHGSLEISLLHELQPKPQARFGGIISTDSPAEILLRSDDREGPGCGEVVLAFEGAQGKKVLALTLLERRARLIHSHLQTRSRCRFDLKSTEVSACRESRVRYACSRGGDAFTLGASSLFLVIRPVGWVWTHLLKLNPQMVGLDPPYL